MNQEKAPIINKAAIPPPLPNRRQREKISVERWAREKQVVLDSLAKRKDAGLIEGEISAYSGSLWLSVRGRQDEGDGWLYAEVWGGTVMTVCFVPVEEFTQLVTSMGFVHASDVERELEATQPARPRLFIPGRDF